MSAISLDDVKKLAKLSSLKLTEQEMGAMQNDLAQILDYVEQLDDVDTKDVEPTYQVNGLETVTRPDSIIDYGVSQESLLQNAPKQQNSSIVVPRVIE